MNYKRTKLACYYSYLSMSSAFCVPSLLFVTFHERYGVSYTLLGTLVLINFCTQLSIDLTFTFFSRFFNIKKTVVTMPFITSAGLFAYAIIPTLTPENAYLGLCIGTVLFSVSAGLSEVLVSPIVAAIPSEHPDRDMSMLHSLYAWGLVIMILISTLFLRIFGTENWMYLVMFLALLPIGAGVLYATAPIPEIHSETKSAAKTAKWQMGGIALCVACIFLGSAAENVMTNWISGFMENGLSVPKAYCDIVGMAVFAVLLGGTRTLYGKYGKNIINVLLFGMLGATVCYLTAGLCSNTVICSVACILVGAFTAMLWPGTLIMMEEHMPALGVAAYALMAAGGDFGAAVAPQLMGAVTDAVAKSELAATFALAHSLTPDQVGLKVGMTVTAFFPLVGTALVLFIRGWFGKKTATH